MRMKCLAPFLLSLLCPALWSQTQQSQNQIDLETGLASVWVGPLELKSSTVMNGVGAPENAVSSEMTLAFTLQAQTAEAEPGVSHIITAKGSATEHGWALWLNAMRQVVFEIRDASEKPLYALKSVEPVRADTAHHLAAVVKRDTRQALSGLWVDGVEVASIAIPAGRAVLWPSDLRCGGSARAETISELRLYNRALVRPEILELALRGNAVPAAQTQPFGQQLDFTDGDVLAVVGGSEAVAMLEDGQFEAKLISACRGKRVRVRDLSWEADTVFRQDRPMNFGTLEQQLKRVGATCVLLMFGRQECLDSKGSPDQQQAFMAKLSELVKRCKTHTQRVILAGPVPFGSPSGADQPDLRKLQPALDGYVKDMGALAKREGIFWAGVLPAPEGRFTTDGLQLNPTGCLLAAQAVLKKVVVSKAPVLSEEKQQTLLRQVRLKQQLWHDYWRPSNWAFLHGDRSAQPSSRDHLTPSVRWFPAELERYQQRISVAEQKIAELHTPERVLP